MKSVYGLLLVLVTGYALRAQVPVSQDPRHHMVLQNEYVRALDVHIMPGDTSLFHIHARPSVFLILNHAHSGSEVLSQGKSDHIAGDIYFEGFYDQPRIHRVWNEDNYEFRVMDVELVNDRFQQAGKPISDSAFKLLFDEKPVRAYQLTLYPSQKISLEKRKLPLLLVSLSDSLSSVSINRKAFSKKSDFIFVKAGDSISFSNQGNIAARFAVLELK
jgi:hypothetical protein